MIWIPITIAASFAQVARNAAQRSVMGDTGPWGATLVRFLFGLPFTAVFVGLAFALTRGEHPHATPAFWAAALLGGASQIAATAALLVAMRRAGFAVATAVQQSSIPLAALLGLVVYGEQLSAVGWTGVALASAALLVVTWPRAGASGEKPISGALYALLSGLAFGFCLNAFRQAGHALEPVHPIFAAVVTLMTVQIVQTLALTLYLAVGDRAALVAVAKAWRRSLGAGFWGAAASAGWFIALALAPAGQVRAVGVIEAPIAALAGRRLFAERLTAVQMIFGLIAAAGVAMAALG
ncbi:MULTISPECIES: DMT family transporter [Caulobacter]|jgi:drug/metabolite transporter (DMT)-like permease|uniref:Drug/metabolite transporter (DMT)-like permease n=1 Tax=Caulobacter rhizosphaerae TaxID=2010972 RepID=A0ABU1MZ29_9CAUL|nr:MULTISPECIES: DMT family transporter [Caulobacter]KQZ19013.1 multidrug transporter [Caulobacter sp. Root1472]MDR6531424.1 drug/metabolite transporter (DMT)-like permease [Caulobacter rhizosphaerae]